MRPDVRLHAVVMQTCVHGVSTRKVDDSIATLGIAGHGEFAQVVSQAVVVATGALL